MVYIHIHISCTFLQQKEWSADIHRGVADALFSAHENTKDENGNLLFSEDNIRLTVQNLVVAGQ